MFLLRLRSGTCSISSLQFSLDQRLRSQAIALVCRYVHCLQRLACFGVKHKRYNRQSFRLDYSVKILQLAGSWESYDIPSTSRVVSHIKGSESIC
jgi:hypothetical protein